MRIGILGSGLMGGKLGTIFTRAGHEVVFSYARRAQKLKQARTGCQGQGEVRYTTGGCAGGRCRAVSCALVPNR